MSEVNRRTAMQGGSSLQDSLRTIFNETYRGENSCKSTVCWDLFLTSLTRLTSIVPEEVGSTLSDFQKQMQDTQNIPRYFKATFDIRSRWLAYLCRLEVDKRDGISDDAFKSLTDELADIKKRYKASGLHNVLLLAPKDPKGALAGFLTIDLERLQITDAATLASELSASF